MARGGKRPGAGRPPKQKPASAITFDSAEDYLAAVVAGTEPADQVRVQAAKCLMAYQQPKTRVPAKSARPTDIHKANASALEQQLIDEWAAKAAKVRERMSKKNES